MKFKCLWGSVAHINRGHSNFLNSTQGKAPPQNIKDDFSCAERRRGNTGNTGSDDRCKSFFFLIHCSFYLFCRSSRLPTTIMVPCPLFAGSTNQIQLPLLCLSLFMFILFLYSCQKNASIAFVASIAFIAVACVCPC